MADRKEQQASMDVLVELKRSSEAARVEATAGVYSGEAWAPWLEAAEAFQAAVTEHAERHGLNRFDVEVEATRRALHPEEAE